LNTSPAFAVSTTAASLCQVIQNKYYSITSQTINSFIIIFGDLVPWSIARLASSSPAS
jgi:hypothetical protein